MDAIIQLMDDRRSGALFRTEAQFLVLGELFTNPGLETTVGALAERLGVPQATVSRGVARLAESGLVRTRREGNRTLVCAELESSIAPELQALLAKLDGPPMRIRAALAAITGVERAVIFGSWAARWQGRAGPVPADIDLLVIGEVDHDAVWTAAAELTRELAIAVNPTIRTPEEWEQDPTGFARQVKDGPQVDVTPDASAEQRA
jgi:DNA-binding transcriptional ArsR family regulator